jgi:hypothetical protein
MSSDKKDPTRSICCDAQITYSPQYGAICSRCGESKLELPHLLHCNVYRHHPIGTPGCVCRIVSTKFLADVDGMAKALSITLDYLGCPSNSPFAVAEKCEQALAIYEAAKGGR